MFEVHPRGIHRHRSCFLNLQSNFPFEEGFNQEDLDEIGSRIGWFLVLFVCFMIITF